MDKVIKDALALECFDVDNSKVSAIMSSTEETTSIFDDITGSTVQVRRVPGTNYKYVQFGSDDQLPYNVMLKIGADEVTSQNKLFNVLTCYGAGLRFCDNETNKPTNSADVLGWSRRQFLARYLLEQITDMKYFYFAVAVIILSRDGKSIVQIRHKDACYCRLEEADKKGRINHVFFANWRDGLPDKNSVECIPLLDEHDPLTDLQERLGLIPGSKGKKREPNRIDNSRKFALLLRFPTVGSQYYPIPYYSAIFRGGSYDEKRLISIGKRAKLRNQSSVKYQVEIHRDYWTRLIHENKEAMLDPEKAKKLIEEEKNKIKDFVAGIENSGKIWISGFYVNPDGHEVHDIVVKTIDRNKEGGDWAEDLSAASNTICYGDNIHPNLVGATPGKSQMNNSGSDKRELFTLKQSLEVAFHDMLLQPLQLVCDYNGWNVYPTIPMIQLTTLDQHTDAQIVNNNDN